MCVCVCVLVSLVYLAFRSSLQGHRFAFALLPAQKCISKLGDHVTHPTGDSTTLRAFPKRSVLSQLSCFPLFIPDTDTRLYINGDVRGWFQIYSFAVPGSHFQWVVDVMVETFKGLIINHNQHHHHHHLIIIISAVVLLFASRRPLLGTPSAFPTAAPKWAVEAADATPSSLHPDPFAWACASCPFKGMSASTAGAGYCMSTGASVGSEPEATPCSACCRPLLQPCPTPYNLPQCLPCNGGQAKWELDSRRRNDPGVRAELTHSHTPSRRQAKGWQLESVRVVWMGVVGLIRVAQPPPFTTHLIQLVAGWSTRCGALGRCGVGRAERIDCPARSRNNGGWVNGNLHPALQGAWEGVGKSSTRANWGRGKRGHQNLMSVDDTPFLPGLSQGFQGC